MGNKIPPAVFVSLMALRIRIRSPNGARERESGLVARANPENMILIGRCALLNELIDRSIGNEALDFGLAWDCVV